MLFGTYMFRYASHNHVPCRRTTYARLTRQSAAGGALVLLGRRSKSPQESTSSLPRYIFTRAEGQVFVKWSGADRKHHLNRNLGLRSLEFTKCSLHCPNKYFQCTLKCLMSACTWKNYCSEKSLIFIEKFANTFF